MCSLTSTQHACEYRLASSDPGQPSPIRKFHELLHPAFTNHDRPVSSGDAYRAPLWRELHLRQAFDACDEAPLTSADTKGNLLPLSEEPAGSGAYSEISRIRS
jgi:hypothetical protein